MAALRVSQASKRALVALRKRPFHIPQDPAPAIPSQRIVDEERSPRYNPEAYYPAKPGEILADKYQLMSKIGWGSGSTVWLARDIDRQVSSDLHGTQADEMFVSVQLALAVRRSCGAEDLDRSPF